MSMMLDRLPPQSEDAEQSVLGAMLLERDAILRAQELVRAEDFYKEAHKRIFAAMVDLHNRGDAVDLITLAEELRRRHHLEASGGITYLTVLANAVPSAANVEHYARIVQDKAVLRALSAAATGILSRVYAPDEDLQTLLADAERQVLEIAQRRSVRSYEHIKDVLGRTLDQIEFLYENKGQLTGIPTGFADLDALTTGLQKSDLIVIAARPSMGKTQLGLNFARHAAVEKGKSVAIFSLEMSAEQLAMRLISAEGQIDSQRLRSGHLMEEHWKRLGLALARLSEAPIYIDDTPGLSVTEIRARTRRLQQEQGLDLVLIDYLQLMQGRGGRAENRQQEISEISRSLKALARELKVPVVALSQLSRAVESRTDKRPMLSDLRESGAIEQDADLVAFIYRDDYYNPESERPNITEVIIAKQRNGPVGKVDLVFLKDYGKFVSVDRRHTEQ